MSGYKFPMHNPPGSTRQREIAGELPPGTRKARRERRRRKMRLRKRRGYVR